MVQLAGTPCHCTGSPGFPEKLSQMLGVRVVESVFFPFPFSFVMRELLSD
jgi:hypothetical protein